MLDERLARRIADRDIFAVGIERDQRRDKVGTILTRNNNWMIALCEGDL